MHKANDRKVLLIGWDAADWKVIKPLMEQDKMPSLKRFLETASYGNITTLRPILSPMLWTSIATGKRPYKHGIHGFTEPGPDGKSIRPITNLSRKTKAVWNILNQSGKTPIVVGWWPSNPAEPIRGCMVSNHYQKAVAPLGKPWPMKPGTVHPDRLAQPLEEFRFHPHELSMEHILPFIPNIAKVDQRKDKRIGMLANIIADTTSIHGAATALMQLEPWDFMAVYYDAIDHFGHGFMKYHPPKQDHISEEDFEIYSEVIESGYRFHDMILGTLLQLAGPETTVILMSDHGFHPDHLRPKAIPAEPAGPAVEHRRFGIFAVRGPGIKKNNPIDGVSLIDVTPTILSLYGLPIGEDMDGKPVLSIFEEPPAVQRIPSWDEVEGEAGTHPPDKRFDAVESAEALKQLVALGYIEQPSDDAETAIKDCVRELRCNLAEAYMDGNLYADATLILEDLWENYPQEHRFGTKLVECYGALSELPARREAIDRLRANVEKYRIEARAELQKLRPEIEKYRAKKTDPAAPAAIEADQPIDDEDAADIAAAPMQDLEAAVDAMVAADEVSPEGMMQIDEDDAELGAQPLAEAAEKEAGQKVMPRKLQFQIRRLTSLCAPRGRLLRWLEATQALAEGDAAAALDRLQQLSKIAGSHPTYHIQIAGALARLSRWEDAMASYTKALEIETENSEAFVGVAECHLGTKQYSEAADAALRVTELAFADPRGHCLLGLALIGMGDGDNAEKALNVALSQAPRYARAHDACVTLYSGLKRDPKLAKEHRDAAKSAREETTWRRAGQRLEAAQGGGMARTVAAGITDEAAPAVWDGVDEKQIITIVSGLPRSGTSMMMQMLAAGGLSIYADDKRLADEDNPLGYMEHEDATKLASDKTWVPKARGKVVKIVAQLLPFLPEGEHYRIVFMHRDLREVLASQTAMLTRLGRTGADLDETKLGDTLRGQVESVLKWVNSRPDAKCLHVRYEDAVKNPAGLTGRLDTFFAGRVSTPAMTAAINPRLRRQRAPGPGAKA